MSRMFYFARPHRRRRARSSKITNPILEGLEQEIRFFKIMSSRVEDYPNWLISIEKSSPRMDYRGKVDVVIKTNDPATFYADIKIDPIEVKSMEEALIPGVLVQSWESNQIIFERTIALITKQRDKYLAAQRTSRHFVLRMRLHAAI